MIILDIPRKVPHHGGYVDIPVYHRTHLGLSQDTVVHYCMLPARPSSPSAGKGASAPELIVSPFAFDIWDQLWRLTTTMTDKAGLLFEVAETMREFGVNILASESSILEERGMYHVEMILHISDEQKVAAIEWTLLARLFEHVEFLPSGRPRLRIRRLANLLRVKQSFDRLTLLGREQRGSVAFRPYRDKMKIEPVEGGSNRPRSLRLRLPTGVRNILKQTVANPPDWGYHLRISDTKDRFLRVVYFSSVDPVLHARVEHDDQTGAYSLITRALRDANFTLLTALTTPSEASGRAISEFVIRAMDADGSDTAEVKRAFEEALASSPAAKDLACKVGYPTGYAAAWEKKPLKPLTRPSMAPTGEAADRAGIVESLRLQQRDLGRILQQGSLSAVDAQRWVLVNQLLARYDEVTQQRAHAALFISCHYEGNQLAAAKKLATELGFVVITGEELERFPNMVAGLVEKIQSCSNFLGIWTDTGAKRSGAESLPSPWLLWELGVAAAFKINWRLLISKNISKDSWARLDASRQHIIYDETNFESKLRSALLALSATPPDRASSNFAFR
jgi:predicted amino acid-binding ACT domain protein